MSPLLYIFMLVAVLLLIIYVTLTILDRPHRTSPTWPRRNFNFEAGQELFNYLPSSREDADTLNIQPRRSGRILVTWKISPRQETQLPQLVLRIYDSSRPDSYMDVEAHNWHGKLSFVSKTGTAYYVAVGFKASGEFTPLLLSAPVVGGSKTLLH